MATKPARSFEFDTASSRAPAPRHFAVTIDGVKGRTLSVSSSGCTVLTESRLPEGGRVSIMVAPLAERGGRLTFRSDLVGTVVFDAPLSDDEYRSLSA